jgi:pimeloyl-ACP methyl ester carboxylesterase
MLPFLPVRWLMRDRFDSKARAGQVQQPVLVIHGTNDEVVPFELGETLSQAFPSARLVRIEGGRHNDVSDRGFVWRELETLVVPR